MLNPGQQSVFRPLVSRAWHAQAALLGADERDRMARDRWYRDQLFSACGITSTKAAGGPEYRRLLERFRMLSEEAAPIGVEGWTDAQNAQFAKLVDRAWTEALRRGTVEEAQHFSEWLTLQLEAAGVYSRRAPDRRESFDRAMAHFAVMAGDEYWIEQTAKASEARMRYVISNLMRDLSDLTGDQVDWGYCRGIYSQMHLPLTIDEAPAAFLWNVLQALDTHVRRLRRNPRSLHVTPKDLPF